MRIAALIALVSAALLAGCGSSSDETTGPGTEATTSAQPSGQQAPLGARAHTCDSTAEPPGLNVVGGSCDSARQTLAAWRRTDQCSSPAGASRYACSVGGFRCLGIGTDRGIAVTCIAPGPRSVAFVSKPG